MKRVSCILVLLMVATSAIAQKDLFPDGTPVPEWFHTVEPTDINRLGKQYRLTDYDVVCDSNILQTWQIQAVIDKAAAEGGGVVVVPRGTFLSGSLFFKQGVHLHLEKDAVLKGSEHISDFALLDTRIEGKNRKYFAALVNADGLNGFTISGTGTLNGNGTYYWRAFWLRWQWNQQSKTLNLDEQRPRLLFVSHCKNVQISGVKLINSPFWTSHYYKCENVKLLNLYIFAPHEGERAPSSDAIDVDACRNMLIKNCYISVNDDAIAMKGGRGVFADKDPNNGGNYNVIIEDCRYGFCHSALTFGSDAIYNRNIILRRATFNDVQRVLWLKMRPDTPQRYEYIRLEDISGTTNLGIDISPWMQFFDLEGEKDIRLSYGDHITFRNINLICNTPFFIKQSEQYQISNFTFDNVTLSYKNGDAAKPDFIKGLVWKNVKLIKN